MCMHVVFISSHSCEGKISYLIRACGLQNPTYVRSFRFVVHSRFDQSVNNRFHDDIDILYGGGEHISLQELLLYSDTGDSLT